MYPMPRLEIFQGKREGSEKKLKNQLQGHQKIKGSGIHQLNKE